MNKSQTKEREEVVVIGGGLGGCLTALEIAKNPKFHVTIIEKQPVLLNGASLIASRLHLGGEYPLSKQTKLDCLNSAVIWKLMMPRNIYTKVPPIKYLLARQTDEGGHVGERNGITLDMYENSYEKIRKLYHDVSNRVGEIYHWDADRTAKELFGAPDKETFFHRMEPEEYADYSKPRKNTIAGGFQTSEIGLNVPKYLTMITKEIQKQQRLGNITVKTGCDVVKNGISGNLGNYKVLCGDGKAVRADQVVCAAWAQNPELVPLDGHVDVYKRAMLLVDLPQGWKTEPAFIMLGKYGGMLSPYNDKTAVCYLPRKSTAYVDEAKLDAKFPSLPESWEQWKKGDREAYTQHYFTLLKKRFPILKDATNPRLIVRDTLNFQTSLKYRAYEEPKEARDGDESHEKNQQALPLSAPTLGLSLGMHQKVEQKQSQIQSMYLYDDPIQPPQEIEDKKGLFVLYPTKATYAVSNAIQAANMVEQRSASHRIWVVAQKDVLHLIEQDLKGYSLDDMEEPSQAEIDRFLKTHPDIRAGMEIERWHGVENHSNSNSFQAKFEQRKGKKGNSGQSH